MEYLKWAKEEAVLTVKSSRPNNNNSNGIFTLDASRASNGTTAIFLLYPRP